MHRLRKSGGKTNVGALPFSPTTFTRSVKSNGQPHHPWMDTPLPLPWSLSLIFTWSLSLTFACSMRIRPRGKRTMGQGILPTTANCACLPLYVGSSVSRKRPCRFHTIYSSSWLPEERRDKSLGRSLALQAYSLVH